MHPGSWTVHNGPEIIGTFQSRDDALLDAAAPEMAKALEVVDKCLAHLQKTHPLLCSGLAKGVYQTDSAFRISCARNVIEAALRKARGED